MGEVVLVAGNGLVEGLSKCETAEMEALAPAVLVQVGRKIVVVSCQSSIFVSARLKPLVYVRGEGVLWVGYLSSLFGLFCSFLVVPVFEVLVYSRLLSGLILLEYSTQAALDLSRLSVQGLVKGRITGMVFLFERRWRHGGILK